MLSLILKLIAAALAFGVLFSGCQIIRNGQSIPLAQAQRDVLRLATCNVHYIVPDKEAGAWSQQDWDRRKGPLNSAVQAIGADIIAFQEMETFSRRNADVPNLTLDYLTRNNPDFAVAAVGDPKTFPSTQPIFFRKAALDLQDQGWFFFSKTPDVIYSRTFNGSWSAFASWAAFQDKRSGKAFRVINIHTDYASRSNRLQSAELVKNRIVPWIADGETVFVAGDLNARSGAETLRIIEEAGVEFAPVQGSTYHLNRGLNLFGAIDHIGVAGNARQFGEAFVMRKKFDGEWPTDHYPVIVDYVLQ